MLRLLDRSRWCLFLLPLVAGAGCSGSDPVTPTEVEPAITVQGVEDGASYTGPVTITIAVDPGTYSARLNGATFLSGQTVSEIGDYTLVVEARNGLATRSRTVEFAIVQPPRDRTSVLLIRLLDLGDNDAGGGGDAILLSDSSAAGIEHALVDAGPAGTNGAAHGYVADRLRALGVDTLSFVQLTHAHSDHFQGLDEVLGSVHVKRFIHNGQVRNYWEYEALLNTAATRADSVIVLTALRQAELGYGEVRTEVDMIPPLPSYLGTDTNDGSLLNEGSIGTGITRAAFRMFLTGDGEAEANERWRLGFASVSGDLDVLKVGHHGANDAVFDNGFSGASSWLDHTDPETLLISANGTTHPRNAALNRILTGSNTRTYCTNVHGDITVRVTAEGIYDVTVEQAADDVCVAGSEATT